MIKEKLKSIANVAIRMLYPDLITCIICGDELTESSRYGVCEKCKPVTNDLYCEHCGRAIGHMARFCDKCITYGGNYFTLARSAVELEDNASAMVYGLKYGGKKYMARYMAEYMLDTYYENEFDPDIITFVPLHKKRQSKRGYNQAELLAKRIGEYVKVDVRSLLEKTVHTTNLAKLDSKERFEKIKNSFKFNSMSDIKGKTILLIDDIMTTGATVNECSKCLLSLGAAKVVVLTFAATKNVLDLY